MSQIEWIYTISWIAFSVVVLAYALCRQPEPAALGGPASACYERLVKPVNSCCRPPREAQQRANVAYAPSSDEDWYTVGFQVPPGSTPQGFVAKFSLKVEDPSLGVLFLDLWQSDLCTPGGPPIRVAGGDILDTQTSQSGACEASVTARVRTDLQYFLHVFGGIQKSLVRVYGGNCYTHVRAEVLDIGGVPAPSPQSANGR